MKFRGLLVVALALPLAGCFKQKTLVVVNPDGSGNIVVSSLMSPQAAGMIGGMTQGFAGALGATNAAAPAKDPFYNEDELKSAAPKFGEGVSFVKARKSNENGWQGSVAVYAFSDVNKLKVPLNDEKKMGGGDLDAGAAAAPAAADETPKQVLTFALSGGDTKTLKITVPQEDAKKKPAAPEKKEGGNAAADAMGQAMLAPMMQMMKGLDVSLAVQVKGQVVKSTAMNNEADGRVVIMHMDMDKMQTSPKFAKIFQSSQENGGNEMPTSDLLGMPGFQFETNKVVEVQFK